VFLYPNLNYNANDSDTILIPKENNSGEI